MTEKIQPPALNKQGKVDMRKARHPWKTGYPKLSTDQVTEMAKRYLIGATQVELAAAFDVTVQTVRKHMKAAGVLRPPKGWKDRQEFRDDPKKKVKKFEKEAASILWRVDGPGKERYTQWRKLITELVEDTECSWEDAVVQASREQKCLRNLIRQYKLWEFTLLLATEVELKMVKEEEVKKRAREISLESYQSSQTEDTNAQTTNHTPQQVSAATHTALSAPQVPITSQPMEVECQDIEQPFRQNLAWAIQAAGLRLRTGQTPETCPNDSAFFLYQQACENPKDFLGKFAQIEGRTQVDEDEGEMKRSGRRAISEIEELLSALEDAPQEETYKQEYIEESLSE